MRIIFGVLILVGKRKDLVKWRSWILLYVRMFFFSCRRKISIYMVIICRRFFFIVCIFLVKQEVRFYKLRMRKGWNCCNLKIGEFVQQIFRSQIQVGVVFCRILEGSIYIDQLVRRCGGCGYENVLFRFFVVGNKID